MGPGQQVSCSFSQGRDAPRLYAYFPSRSGPFIKIGKEAKKEHRGKIARTPRPRAVPVESRKPSPTSRKTGNPKMNKHREARDSGNGGQKDEKARNGNCTGGERAKKTPRVDARRPHAEIEILDKMLEK